VAIEELPEIITAHFIDSEAVKPTHIGDGGQSSVSDFFKGQEKIVLRNCGRIDPLNIQEYCGTGGYSALCDIITSGNPDAILEKLEESGLRGRGGAGFPTWLKWKFTKNAEGDETFVLCNADEGDPGAFMDRSVLEGDPHSLIEGMAIAAYTVGARRGFVYVRAEYPLAVSRLSKAIDQAEELGLLGENILGSEFSFGLEIRMGSGAFVCGEETALMHSIEGKRGEPRPRPPFPANKGLWNKPSLLNNVETYANVPVIMQKGPSWFASFGTDKSRGTKVFALAGAVENTGLVEVPIGTTLGELVFDIGGGIKNGKEFKAAQIGGPSGGCIPRQHLNVALDYESVTELGAIMGSGGLIIMDEETCMVDVARFFIEFVQEESCGKCTPCRVGTKRMLEILERICAGSGMEGDIEKLIELGHMIKESSLCGLGQTAPNPVLSTIRYFRDEYEEHIKEKKCSAGVCPSLVRAPCQSACPAGVDIPGFVSLVGEKRYAEALRLHRERNPFAAVCARICFHTCEDRCRRATLDQPVSVRGIKRYMADQEIIMQTPEVRESAENAKRRIAIIGAGPAGLSCGYFLARMGYRPVIFERELRPGGMMVQTIPAYRLPRETLAREIRMIEQLGVEIRTEHDLGRDITLKGLYGDGYESVFLAVGAAHGAAMGVPGETLSGVVQGTDFLRQYNIRGAVPVGKKVVVIGGGNAAVDAARTALRLGAEVTIVYRRTKDQMPAYAEEIEEALNEGVSLECLMQPIEILGNGSVTGLRCMHMKLGEFDRSGRRRPTETNEDTVTFECDQVIIAIGHRLHVSEFKDLPELVFTQSGYVQCDPLTGQTSVDWLFSGGDAVRGPSSVVQAIGDGERAAYGIDLYLTGSDHAFWRKERIIDTEFDPDADPVPYTREKLRTTDVSRRRHNFDEVEMPWIESVAMRECKRCLRCDYSKTPAEEKEAQHV
ncbi:MAG: NADH-ubiquinone oxidoreductase-F iron-sulfur binding region domain-containing protein, partial [Spirochaetota bacterium]